MVRPSSEQIYPVKCTFTLIITLISDTILKMEKYMTDYLVRRTKYAHEVTKFDDSSEPSGTYTITGRGCNCPARVRSCKHIKIFKAWEKGGKLEGQIFDDTAQVIGSLFWT